MREKHIVEPRIDKSRCQRYEKSLHGAAIRDIKSVEYDHQNDKGREEHIRREISATVGIKLGRSAEKRQNRLHEEEHRACEQYAERRTDNGEQREAASRQCRIALTQRLGNERRAARRKHDGKPKYEIQRRIDDVRRCEREASRIASDEDAVRHRIDRNDEHHADGGRSEAQKTAETEMLCQWVHEDSPFAA